MFGELATAVAELEIPVESDALVEVLNIADRLDAKVSGAVGEFAAAGLYELDGTKSMQAWLRTRAKLSAKDAYVVSRTVARLKDLPRTAAAWRTGELAGGQIDAVVNNLNDRVAPLFAEHEADLIPALAPLSVTDTVDAMREWRRRADANEPTPPEPPVRTLYASPTLDGTVEINGTLDIEGGEIVRTALRVAERRDGEGETRTPAERRADALVDVCRHYLDHQHDAPKRRNRPHINIVVPAGDTSAGRIVGGPPLDVVTMQRLLCDATVARLVVDQDSVVLDYGTPTPIIGTGLWNALVLRDQHCRGVGCDTPWWHCDAHHVKPRAEGGLTELANLVLKCPRDHHMAHHNGWDEKLLPDGTLHITMTDGRTFTTHPPGF